MPKGPNRLQLDRYLDTAQEGALTGSGSDWKKKADALRVLADAMMAGAEQAELRIGEQTLTGPALRKGIEDSATSMADKSDRLRAAGDALVQVGTQVADVREARDSLKDLGEKPSPYQPPAGTPGVPLAIDDFNAQAAASQTRQGERTSWQDAFDKQEAQALALTRQMDSSFLGAIPPMKAIHGQDDPTEPPPHVLSGPGGPLLPGTQVPAGGGADGGGGTVDDGRVAGQPGPRDADPQDPDRDRDRGHDRGQGPGNPTPDPDDPDPTHGDPPGHQPDPTHRGPQVPAQTTTVSGTSQAGVTYNPGGQPASTPVSASPSPGMSTGAAMGAAGMAGGAGAAGMAGAARGGSAPAAPGRSGSAPVRAIGSTGRAGSASALSRGTSAGSSAARPTAPGATSGTRAGAPGSAVARSGAAGRGGAAGAAGARSAAGTAAGGRGGRSGDREQTTDRDSLVYDQDWLGDDEVASGVLD